MCLLARTHVSSGQDTCVFWPGHMRLLARTHVSSSQDTCVFWLRHMCLLARTHVSSSQTKKFRRKFLSKNFADFFFRRQKMKCRGSSETHFPKVWGRTEPSLGGKRPFKILQKLYLFYVFGVEKWNVGDRLKRVSPKFEAERSHPWGINGHSKFFY